MNFDIAIRARNVAGEHSSPMHHIAGNALLQCVHQPTNLRTKREPNAARKVPIVIKTTNVKRVASAGNA